LIFLFVRFRRDIGGLSALNEGGRVATNAILKLSIPVTLSSALLPLSALLDSVIIVRLMQKYAENAVTLYGLFSGGAVTLVNLPVSVCYGIAAAGVPALSAAFADKGNARKKMLFALFLTVAISLPCAVGLFVLAKPAVNILFRALGEEGSAVLIRLVKLLSVSAIFLSCTQTLSACLTGMGKPKYAAISMAVAVTVKTLLNVILVSDPKNSVYGAAIAADVCYFVAFFLDLLYNLYVTKTNNGGLS
jgi:stage V sporulation protein B